MLDALDRRSRRHLLDVDARRQVLRHWGPLGVWCESETTPQSASSARLTGRPEGPALLPVQASRPTVRRRRGTTTISSCRTTKAGRDRSGRRPAALAAALQEHIGETVDLAEVQTPPGWEQRWQHVQDTFELDLMFADLLLLAVLPHLVPRLEVAFELAVTLRYGPVSARRPALDAPARPLEDDPRPRVGGRLLSGRLRALGRGRVDALRQARGLLLGAPDPPRPCRASSSRLDPIPGAGRCRGEHADEREPLHLGRRRPGPHRRRHCPGRRSAGAALLRTCTAPGPGTDSDSCTRRCSTAPCASSPSSSDRGTSCSHRARTPRRRTPVPARSVPCSTYGTSRALSAARCGAPSMSWCGPWTTTSGSPP